MLHDLERNLLRILFDFSSQHERMPSMPTGLSREDIIGALRMLVEQQREQVGEYGLLDFSLIYCGLMECSNGEPYLLHCDLRGVFADGFANINFKMSETNCL